MSVSAQTQFNNDLGKAHELIKLGKNSTNCIVSNDWKDGKFSLDLTSKNSTYNPFEFETTDAKVTINESNNALMIEEIAQGTLQEGAERFQITFQGSNKDNSITRIFAYRLKLITANTGTFLKPNVTQAWTFQDLLIDCQ